MVAEPAVRPAVPAGRRVSPAPGQPRPAGQRVAPRLASLDLQAALQSAAPRRAEIPRRCMRRACDPCSHNAFQQRVGNIENAEHEANKKTDTHGETELLWAQDTEELWFTAAERQKAKKSLMNLFSIQKSMTFTGKT